MSWVLLRLQMTTEVRSIRYEWVILVWLCRIVGIGVLGTGRHREAYLAGKFTVSSPLIVHCATGIQMNVRWVGVCVNMTSSLAIGCWCLSWNFDKSWLLIRNLCKVRFCGYMGVVISSYSLIQNSSVGSVEKTELIDGKEYRTVSNQILFFCNLHAYRCMVYWLSLLKRFCRTTDRSFIAAFWSDAICDQRHR